MKITFISNACAIYEAKGFRLLADPWLTEPAFGSWVHEPPLKTKPEDVLDVDALYISHIHPDHLDPNTLKLFRKDIPIITLHDKYNFCTKKLEKLGFKDIRATPDTFESKLGPFKLTTFGPFTKHPFFEDSAEIGNIVDSALLIEAGGIKILNTNDNTPDLASAYSLRNKYGPFDMVQLNFNNAGAYPACFDNLSLKEKNEEAIRCVNRNLDHMLNVARGLNAKFTMPFAGAYKLGYGLEHMNAYLGTTSALRACDFLLENGVRPLYLVEGEVYEL